ncbi:MAG: DUF222 domain-containing protein [Deltaproteobacteria bacterium]|nr:DUF222 domain-containing protein [Deltaproteobacteria bacterium]
MLTTAATPPTDPTVDPRTLTDDALERAVADLSAQLDAAEHRLLTLIREMDRRGRHAQHGLPSMAAWLGWRVGLGPVAAREKVRVAKALADLPPRRRPSRSSSPWRRRRPPRSSRRSAGAWRRSPPPPRTAPRATSARAPTRTAWC